MVRCGTMRFLSRGAWYAVSGAYTCMHLRTCLHIFSDPLVTLLIMGAPPKKKDSHARHTAWFEVSHWRQVRTLTDGPSSGGWFWGMICYKRFPMSVMKRRADRTAKSISRRPQSAIPPSLSRSASNLVATIAVPTISNMVSRVGFFIVADTIALRPTALIWSMPRR